MLPFDDLEVFKWPNPRTQAAVVSYIAYYGVQTPTPKNPSG